MCSCSPLASIRTVASLDDRADLLRILRPSDFDAAERHDASECEQKRMTECHGVQSAEYAW